MTSNSQITDNQKLQYLKTSLKGDAAKLLTSLQNTDANFSKACDILKNRYDNKCLILRAHIHAIIAQKPVTNEDTRTFRDLIETIEEYRLALSNLGQPPVDDQGIFFTYLFAETLPAKTTKFWEFLSPGRNPKRYLDMKKFIEKRTRAFEAAPHSSQHQPSTRSPHF